MNTFRSYKYFKRKDEEESTKKQEALENKQKDEGLWTMYFDGSVAKVGVGLGVYIISPIMDFVLFLEGPF